MSRFMLLDNQTHAALRYEDRLGVDCGLNNHLIPVIAREVPMLMSAYPVFFVKDPATGAFGLAALLGFDPDENLFLDGDTWAVPYVPLHVRRGGFNVQKAGEGTVKVGIDTEDPRFNESGAPLFDADGKASPFLDSMNSILATLLDGAPETGALIEALAAAGVLHSVALQVEFKDGQSVRFDSLYSVNEEALAKLSREQVQALHAAGHLRLATLIAASTVHLQALIDRRNLRL